MDADEHEDCERLTSLMQSKEGREEAVRLGIVEWVSSEKWQKLPEWREKIQQLGPD